MKRDTQISIPKKKRDSAHVEELPVFHGGYLSISRNPCLNQHLMYEKGRLRRHSISPCASTLNSYYTLFVLIVFKLCQSFVLPACFVMEEFHLPYLMTSSLPRKAPLHHGHLRQELSALRPEANDGISVKQHLPFYIESLSNIFVRKIKQHFVIHKNCKLL